MAAVNSVPALKEVVRKRQKRPESENGAFLHMRPGSTRGKAADFCRVDGDIDEKCKKVYNRMPKKYI